MKIVLLASAVVAVMGFGGFAVYKTWQGGDASAGPTASSQAQGAPPPTKASELDYWSSDKPMADLHRQYVDAFNMAAKSHNRSDMCVYASGVASADLQMDKPDEYAQMAAIRRKLHCDQ